MGSRDERGVAHLQYGGVPDMPLRGANDAVDGRRALCVLTDARLHKQQLEPLDVNTCALEMRFQRLPQILRMRRADHRRQCVDNLALGGVQIVEFSIVEIAQGRFCHREPPVKVFATVRI